MEVIEVIEKKDIVSNEESLHLFYAFGCEEDKTWYVSSDKTFKFKNSILLLKLSCKYSNKKRNTSILIPKVGDVGSSIFGEIIEIIELEWI